MKLQNEFEFVEKRFKKNIGKIKAYAPVLKASGNYNDFETRLTFDCLYAFVGSTTMCEWYEKYNCNDKNINTLGKKVLRKLNII